MLYDVSYNYSFISLYCPRNKIKIKEKKMKKENIRFKYTKYHTHDVIVLIFKSAIYNMELGNRPW